MGQEASLPAANDAAALDEQLAPPSAALPVKSNNNKPKMIGNLMRSLEQQRGGEATTLTTTRANSDDAFALQKMPDAVPEKKSGIFPGRPSARGVISQMRNLSMGIHHHNRHSKHHQKTAEQVQDWDKQWFDDDDDDDDDEDEDDTAVEVAQKKVEPQPSLSIIRPGLDTGHTSSMHMPPEVVTPSPPRAAPPPPLPYAVTKEPDLLHPVAATNTSSILEGAGGGRKPDVQMFLPMLRVLGKGSFGKVTYCLYRGTCVFHFSTAFALTTTLHVRFLFPPSGRSRAKEGWQRHGSVVCHEDPQEDTSRKETTD